MLNQENFQKHQELPQQMTKVIVIGDRGVGKTSIITLFASQNRQKFSLTSSSMIGIDFLVKNLALPTGPLKLQIWDTTGSQRFTLMSMTKNFYNRASGIVIVYSVTDRSSFDGVDKWIQTLNIFHVDIPRIIIGNKCQCEEKRVVETFEGQLIAGKCKAQFFEVSVKQNTNIDEAFLALSTKMMEILKPIESKTHKGLLKDVKNKKQSCF